MTTSMSSDFVNFERAWSLVLSQHFTHVVEQLKKEGEGIALFMFTQRPNQPSTKPHNCKLYFAPKDGKTWKEFVEKSPNRDFILKEYDPTKNVLIFLSIPVGEGGDEEIGGIRLFSIEDGKELVPQDNDTKDIIAFSSSKNGLKRRGKKKTTV